MKHFIPVLLLCIGCQKSQTEVLTPVTDSVPAGFEQKPQVITLRGGALPEASGIADSKLNAGHLWVEQDGGNKPMIHLLKHDGVIVDSVLIEGAVNRDWEDMALANGNLYIGDIGDNNQVYTSYTIYRFPEPVAGTRKVSAATAIKFKYVDGSHDAEAFVVDPVNNDIYLFTKRDAKTKVYKLANASSTSAAQVAEYVTELPYNGVVSAALSPDSKELIIKTYTTLYYYTRSKTDGMTTMLAKTPAQLSYQLEMQGEAIVFNLENKGFFTLSEKAFNVTPALNYYKRKDSK